MKGIVLILLVSLLVVPIASAACSDPISNCISCEPGGTICNACIDGYYLSSGKVCSICPVGKGKASDTSQDAAGNTYTDGNVACTVTCISGCQVCGFASQCLNCKAGYYKSAAGTCSLCSLGRGKSSDSPTAQSAVNQDTTLCNVTCLPTSNCDSCGAEADKAVCLSCAAGQVVQSDGTCGCHPACRACTGQTATSCTSCNMNYYWSAANECSACPSGTFKAAHTGTPSVVELQSSCISIVGKSQSLLPWLSPASIVSTLLLAASSW